jgi:hypothetical protein
VIFQAQKLLKRGTQYAVRKDTDDLGDRERQICIAKFATLLLCFFSFLLKFTDRSFPPTLESKFPLVIPATNDEARKRFKS